MLLSPVLDRGSPPRSPLLHLCRWPIRIAIQGKRGAHGLESFQVSSPFFAGRGAIRGGAIHPSANEPHRSHAPNDLEKVRKITATFFLNRGMVGREGCCRAGDLETKNKTEGCVDGGGQEKLNIHTSRNNHEKGTLFECRCPQRPRCCFPEYRHPRRRDFCPPRAFASLYSSLFLVSNSNHVRLLSSLPRGNVKQ